MHSACDNNPIAPSSLSMDRERLLACGLAKSQRQTDTLGQASLYAGSEPESAQLYLTLLQLHPYVASSGCSSMGTSSSSMACHGRQWKHVHPPNFPFFARGIDYVDPPQRIGRETTSKGTRRKRSLGGDGRTDPSWDEEKDEKKARRVGGNTVRGSLVDERTTFALVATRSV